MAESVHIGVLGPRRTRWPARRIRAGLAVALAAFGAVLVQPSPAAAATPVKVTITIHNVWEVNCDDNDGVIGSDTCGNDYYAKAFFPDGERISPRAPDDLTDVVPNWALTGTVDRDAGPFPVRLQLWDHDSTSGDDLIDIAPGDSNLDFTIDPATGTFSGEIPTPNVGYATGSGEDSAAVFFSVTVGDLVDFDRDGLPDAVERSVIVNKSGTVPEHGDLRALGANPCRPTILVEVDFMNGPDGPDPDTLPDHTHRPTQAAINELVAAFNAGDVPGRPDCPYPVDKSGGVQLLIVVDDALAETDRLDWDTGPGGVTATTIRRDNFDPALRSYFHYSLWIHNQPDLPGSPPRVNDSSGLPDGGKDFVVSLGEWENRVGSTREQSGTFMHELGHTLGLQHGGADEANCKPNYHSIMSYVYQVTGVPDASLPTPAADLNGDGTVDARDRMRLDYSRIELPGLDEDRLGEGQGIGAGPDVFFWDGDGRMPWRTDAGNAPVDWDRDNPRNIDPGTVSADVNFMGIPTEFGCPNATAPPNTPGVVEHRGHDDWASLRYRGILSPPLPGQARPVELDLNTANVIRDAIGEAMGVADLSVRLVDDPDPVAAGTRLTYRLQAHNADATNTAYDVVLTQSLPAEVRFVSASPGCAASGSTVTCRVGEVAPGATTTATVVVDVPADLVAAAGGPKDVGSTATVTHDGTEPNPANNAAGATTRVIAVADLSLSKTADRATATANDPVTYTITVRNAGPSYAHALRVTDDLPDPAEGAFVAATTEDGSCAVETSGDLACAWTEPLAVGAQRRVTVTARVTDDGVQDHITDTAHTSFPGTDPDPAGNTGTVTTGIIKVATTVTAAPVVARVTLPGIQVLIPELSARLTRADDGRPVVGRSMRFTTTTGVLLCTARTDSNGVARCRDVVASLLAVLSLGYRASSTEDGRYLAGSGTGPLVIIN